MTSDWKKFVVKSKNLLPIRQGRRGIFNYGQTHLGLRINVVNTDGPEQFVKANMRLFATGTTSRDEGYFYWALLKLIGPEREPGKNGLVWYYQSKVGQNSGSAVVDFVIEGVGPNPQIGIRIVTPHFHINAGARKRASDFEQQFYLLDNNMLVVDVFSQNYINDPTGRAVLKAAAAAIEGRPDFGPNHRRWK